MEDTGRPWGPYELRPNPQAILRLALGTSVAIATALVIPDALAIAPTTLQGDIDNGPLIWACRVIGLWAYAFVLWSVGFLALLHLLAIVGGGIVVDSEGIKLWKLARRIPWDNIVACTVIERKFFSTLFFIRPCVMQMTLHVRKKDGKGTTVKQVPSFQFTPAEFASLFSHISRLSFAVTPSSVDAFMFQPAEAVTLRKMSDTGRFKRVAISTLIACSLVFVLAQRAACYYVFNTGNKYFNAQDYPKAHEYYQMSVKIYPAFAPGWDKLARCEYRTGDIKNAEEHWQKALFFKPDFVESKLGLSAIYMKQGRIEEAEKKIISAVKLAKTDPAALINLAQVYIYRGAVPEAIRLLQDLSKQDAGRNHVRCLLAQCYVRRGQFKLAQEILDGDKAQLERDPLEKGFYKLVCAELALEQGRVDAAAAILDSLPLQKDNVQLSLDLAQLRLAQNRIPEAVQLLKSTYRQDGKPIATAAAAAALAQARLAWKSDDKRSAEAMFAQVLSAPLGDPGVLARFARDWANRGDKHRAAAGAQRALMLDPENLIAKKIVEEQAP